MTTTQFVLDVGRCFRAAAPPLLVLAAFTLTGIPRSDELVATSLEHPTVLAWRAAVVATSLWFLVAVVWAETRPLRDRRAFDRLQRLREMATSPDRVLVHVQSTVWSSTAGQHLVVVNVATGGSSRVWLPETLVPIGSFVVLEQTDRGVRVVDWMSAHQVEAGHRHERRVLAVGVSNVEQRGHAADPQNHDDARQLIEETEQFLKGQEYRP